MTSVTTCAINQALHRPSVTDSYDYDVFGNKVNSTGATPNNYLYRGEQWDPDLGLYYLRARYYNPLTGRFMSRDPNEGKRWDPKSLHKYLYAAGDPVNAKDATGRDIIEFALGESAVYTEVEVGTTALANRLIACFLTISAALYMPVNHEWSPWGAGQDSVGLYFCLFP